MDERPSVPAYMPAHMDDPVAQPAQFGTAQDARRMMDSLTPHHTPVQPLPSIATVVPRPPDAARDMKPSDWANALGSSYGGCVPPRRIRTQGVLCHQCVVVPHA